MARTDTSADKAADVPVPADGSDEAKQAEQSEQAEVRDYEAADGEKVTDDTTYVVHDSRDAEGNVTRQRYTSQRYAELVSAGEV